MEEVEEESDDGDDNDIEEENKEIIKNFKRKKSMRKRSVYLGDDPEKIELLAKIAELEKNVIDNEKLEDAEVREEGEKVDKNELAKRIKEQEELIKKAEKSQKRRKNSSKLIRN